MVLEPPATVLAGAVPGAEHVLTPEALAFVARLARTFTPRVRDVLARRRDRQRAWDAGRMPAFDVDAAAIRAGDWVCAPLPLDLVDRRVEITGPPEPRRVLHALASGANVYMADLEDALAPTFENLVGAQSALHGAARRTLSARGSDGRLLTVPASPAILMMRPRGWHLWERNVRVDNQPVPAALFDAGLYLFHNAHALQAHQSGPYLYLPKLEDAHEARLWADILGRAQEWLGLGEGSVRVTVLIETFPALFAMEEILHALRHFAAGLNLGRWDLLFSRIKVTAEDPGALLPDREAVTMAQTFLAAATELLVDTCHRRGVLAMGGMAAQIPLRDSRDNDAAIEEVRADKLREVLAGHDGTWVAHPALVPVARDVFDAHMRGPNQIHVTRPAPRVHAADLTAVPVGPHTWDGTLRAIDVALRYLAAWIGGTGCVAMDARMEDAATAEIARTLLWQRVHHRARLDDGSVVDAGRIAAAITSRTELLASTLGPTSRDRRLLHEARGVLERMTLAPRCPDFLTTFALDRLEALTPVPLEA